MQRFEHTASGSFKLETNITFPLQLDIAPFTTKAKRKPSLVTANGDSGPTAVAGTGLSTKNCVYDLLSVVVHKGEINSGHYVSYAREGTQVRSPVLARLPVMNADMDGSSGLCLMIRWSHWHPRSRSYRPKHTSWSM